MSTALKSTKTKSVRICTDGMKFAVIVAEWNKDITSLLLKGALSTLKKAGVYNDDVIVKWVPGAMEIPLAAKVISETTDVEGIVVLGCVIRGDTPHFDYVCSGLTKGVMEVQLNNTMPIGFGVLTTENHDQALERAGGKLGNKGSEAAEAAIRMANLVVEMDERREEDNQFGIHESQFNIDPNGDDIVS